jgi:hypothetical protein
VPPVLSAALRDTAGAMDTAVGRLRRELAGFDPTLGLALDRSARKMRYQLEKMERKVGREALAREARSARDAASLYGLIYPGKHLQERLYSILPFIAKHGFEVIGHIYEHIELDCPDHRVLVI